MAAAGLSERAPPAHTVVVVSGQVRHGEGRQVGSRLGCTGLQHHNHNHNTGSTHCNQCGRTWEAAASTATSCQHPKMTELMENSTRSEVRTWEAAESTARLTMSRA